MNYDCNVKIVDAIMGAGKTSAAINFINSSDSETHFLYITPYLTEVKRIIEACPDKKFKEPKNINGKKIQGIQSLIKKDINIVSTHALFHRFDKETIDLCRAHNYTLIMDEVADVIQDYDIKPDDMELLLNDFVDVDPTSNFLYWKKEKKNYEGEKFKVEKRLCDIQCLALYGDDISGNKQIMMWLFPITAFNAFRNIYIITYMFEAQIQCYYYNFFSLPYSYLYVKGDSPKNYCFTSNKEEMQIVPKDYSKLIHILDNERMNQIGDRESDLSKSWYIRNKNGAALQVKKNLYNFFARIRKAKSNDIIWTTFKDYKNILTGKGYSKGFLPLNIRASNEYRTRTSIAYPVNRYFNTLVKNFFICNGIDVKEEDYALSEMLQFIWRSAIRDDKEIYLYVPSIRMRRKLTEWIEENSIKEEAMT